MEIDEFSSTAEQEWNAKLSEGVKVRASAVPIPAYSEQLVETMLEIGGNRGVMIEPVEQPQVGLRVA